MQKSQIHITMNQDLTEYAKLCASNHRTTVSDAFTQFILNLKRIQENGPMQIVLADQGFRDSLLATTAKIRSGKATWSIYDEVFR